ncbi:hypothetical protein BOTCAL_0301g00030 [Botryotinia calthae]|uniref:Uncharacterized protein n=1 Tax=Botryotinia calthae TaxID=38488 RepID=A0A4Y8CWP8_9HELO|nr:hypothetical protein BOTCAL_0301g00030 [Botryotinia calthae]
MLEVSSSTIELKDQESTAQVIPAIEILSEKNSIPRSTPEKINSSQTVKISNGDPSHVKIAHSSTQLNDLSEH